MTDKILKLVEKVMEVNENTKHDVHVRISPHVEAVSIMIEIGGYKIHSSFDEIYDYYYNGELSNEYKYQEIIERLEELLSE